MSNKLEIPTEEEIAQLPCLAIVAFAARCARRVQPLFRSTNAKHVAAVENAISIAEKNASTSSKVSNWSATYAAARDDAARAAHAAGAADAAARDAADADADYAAAAAARDAAAAAADARDAAVADADARDAAVADAARAARAAFWASSVLVESIRGDFQKLVEAAGKQGWNNTTPVSPDFFGPMWPNGAPDGWPADSSKDDDSGEPIRGLLLNFSFGPNADPEDVERSIVQLYEAANRLHMARGKGVLLPDNFRHWISHALEPAGV